MNPIEMHQRHIIGQDVDRVLHFVLQQCIPWQLQALAIERVEQLLKIALYSPGVALVDEYPVSIRFLKSCSALHFGRHHAQHLTGNIIGDVGGVIRQRFR